MINDCSNLYRIIKERVTSVTLSYFNWKSYRISGSTGFLPITRSHKHEPISPKDAG